jgi:hypothetical protein
VGVITVPDERLTKLAELVHPGRIVPATCEIVDIAGLVKGASKGEGLGNKFLGNIRETDAIIHVSAVSRMIISPTLMELSTPSAIKRLSIPSSSLRTSRPSRAAWLRPRRLLQLEIRTLR